MRKIIIYIFMLVSIQSQQTHAQNNILNENINMMDKSRNRLIPVEFYKPVISTNLPLVIINHGYKAKNTEYSFIANQLVQNKYPVLAYNMN